MCKQAEYKYKIGMPTCLEEQRTLKKIKK